MKGIVLVGFFLGLQTHATETTNFMGDYTQGSQIHFVGANDEKSCKADSSDGQWDGKECVAPKDNKMTISKITDQEGKYLAQISIIGGNIHTCDFAGVMSLQEDKLVYQGFIPDTTQACHIEIEAIDGGVRISAGDSCNQFYCGFGLTLNGSNGGFKRTGDGREVSAADAEKEAAE